MHQPNLLQEPLLKHFFLSSSYTLNDAEDFSVTTEFARKKIEELGKLEDDEQRQLVADGFTGGPGERNPAISGFKKELIALLKKQHMPQTPSDSSGGTKRQDGGHSDDQKNTRTSKRARKDNVKHAEFRTVPPLLGGGFNFK